MIIRTYSCYIFFIGLIISSFMLHTHAAETKKANLYIISDKAFVGDRSQLLGVARESEKYFKSRSITLNVEEYDKSQLETVKDQISNNKNLTIIVSVGYYGIELITKLKSYPELAKKIIAVHLSHQLLDNGTLSHKQLVQEKRDDFFGADIIALPSHALDKQNTKLTGVNTILLTTNGVAHNMQPSDIESEYAAFKSMLSSFDKPSDKFLAVILAGDVPENGTYHCYTGKEAKKLAEYVSNLALKNNYFVLVSNGSRTGKYDCQHNKELSVHEKDSIMDVVTSSFQEILQKNRVPFKLFDFKKGQPSMYKAVLGAVLYNKHSLIIVPGESTSMVSETVDMLPAKTVTVYYNSTMNETHKRYIKNEFNEGRVSIIDENMHLHLPNNTRAKYYSASENIAKGIYTLWHTRTVAIPKVIK
ncbi:hypothetical protein [Candidatus Tisiphia endosymbiont of Ptychoptera albimana]|uniref:hypothetical protein n=1 Tax=Candidatus Tisiphia endosymbiont of Ptychoptera albimana TaxID=3066260 RepID=UPI001D7502CA|nr:hypothetical protein [Rickettsia endosymbiont of Sericostoma sp. HW-2014]